MVQPRPVALTQVNEADYEGAFEPEPLLIVGPVPGGGGGGGGDVASVNGKTGTVVLTASDVGAAPTSHTQAISTITGLQAGLDSKATNDLVNEFAGNVEGAISTLSTEVGNRATQSSVDALSTTKANTADVVPNTRTVAGKPLSSNVALDKIDVGLSNVDNTSDVNKPVSTAQATAIALKANTASPTFTGTVGGITKSMVGLGSVDNTADSAKPVSTAQATAIGLKVNTADVAGLNTVGWNRAVYIPKNGTVPGGTPVYTTVIELEA